MATSDARPDPLRRLGGGRWETKDGRFQIEPQSGTWVVVDTTQTNEFGLPLVRGPYGSLGAAREAIDAARIEGPATSPLAERIEQARTAPERPSKERPAPRASGPASATAAATDTEAPRVEPVGGEPEGPPEPRWLRELKPAGRKRAQGLMDRLGSLDPDVAEQVIRAEVVDGQPAIATLALERLLRIAAASAKDPAEAVAAAIEVFLAGEDDDLGARWRVVDDRERPIRRIDLTED